MKYSIIGRVYDVPVPYCNLADNEQYFNKCLGYMLLDEQGQTRLVLAHQMNRFISMNEQIYDCSEIHTKGIKIRGIDDRLMPYFDTSLNRYKRFNGYNSIVILSIIQYGNDITRVQYLKPAHIQEVCEVNYDYIVRRLQQGTVKALNATIRKGKLVAKSNCYIPKLSAVNKGTYPFLMNSKLQIGVIYDTNVPSVILQERITNITGDTFKGCYNLESIRLHNKLEYIASGAFRDTIIKSISLPPSLKYVHEHILPKTATRVKMYCSWGALDTGVFERSNLEMIEFYDKALQGGTRADYDMRRINGWVFCECKHLSQITIPDCIDSIELYSFYDCGLTSITLPENVKELGYGAFANCKKLKTIEIKGTIEKVWDFEYDEPFIAPFDNCPVEKVILHKPINPDVFNQLGFRAGVQVITKY